MSQPSSDLDFDSPEFAESFESTLEDEGQAAISMAPPAPRYRKQGFSIYSVMLVPLLPLFAGWHDHHVCRSWQI